MTVKIYTTDPNTLKWKTLDSKLKTIQLVLNTAKNADFKVSIEYRDLTPEVINGRITHQWFDFIRGITNDFVILHMSGAQRTKWGIKPTLRGSRHNDNDDIGEMYMWADENTKRGRYNQFIQTILHEIRHELMAGMGLKDDTHDLHGQDRDISPHFAVLDMSLYRPKRQKLVKTLKTVLAEIISRFTPKRTEMWINPFPQWDTVTQHWAVRNTKLYLLTGWHWGTDFPTPENTPIKAPLTLEVTRTGNLPNSLGYWCETKIRDRYVVWCHLKTDDIDLGTYAQGEVFATSGKTGFIKGVHTHIEGWYQPMNRSLMNKNNIKQLTFDVYAWAQEITS